MQLLSDPLNDRQVKTIKPPPHKPLSSDLMFPAKLKFKPDWKLLKEHLLQEGRIAKADFIKLVNEMNKIFKSEGNLLYLSDPLTVVGDIHGQFYDLVKILEIGGNPESTRYLFLGDFVDRGQFSIEINFHKTIYFIRGNHECRQMTQFFNFRDECLYKYDQDIYDICMESFDLIPIGCIVNGKFLAVHGGISPELRTLEELKQMPRAREPPRVGLFCDLLWSDPVDNEDGLCAGIYRGNEVRGCSYFFGIDAVNQFLEANNLLSVIRGHEAQVEGYKMYKWNGMQDFPAVITIFSAPNYCDVYGNKGAIIKFDNNTLNIQQYNSNQHPYLLPNFMDIFSWSLPFVSEKINEILVNVLKPSENEEDDEEMPSSFKEEEKKINSEKSLKKISVMPVEKQNRLRNKIHFVSKMLSIQKTLRENSETIVQLKGQTADGKLQVGLLSEGTDGIKNAIDEFQRIKEADQINERIPEVLPSFGQASKGLCFSSSFKKK